MSIASVGGRLLSAPLGWNDLAGNVRFLHCTARPLTQLISMRPEKERAMTRETKREVMWRALFEEQHSQLTRGRRDPRAPKRLPGADSPNGVAELEHQPFNEPFGKTSALRAVVKAAIAYNYTNIDSWILTASSGPIES